MVSKINTPHPYEDLPNEAFWRSAVADVSPFNIQDMYKPKFTIGKDTPIAAAGSCFAQHIARNLKARGCNFLDMEQSPPGLSLDQQKNFGFNTYSGRFGNIYSVGQLFQMFQRASGAFKPVETCWEHEGRFYDPFRPAIQPNGFASPEELAADVASHLQCLNQLIRRTEVFIFTFGLTEGWINKEDGSILPTCPGTVVGNYDPDKYKFHNFTHSELLNYAKRFIALASKRNPKMKFIFTVSPVPLTATASGNHVLPATIYSKSVLRGVCGELSETYPQCDYFPSYEIISSHPFGGMFFEPNKRGVTKTGVEHAMGSFFSAHSEISNVQNNPVDGNGITAIMSKPQNSQWAQNDDVVCEEELLEAFGSK